MLTIMVLAPPFWLTDPSTEMTTVEVMVPVNVMFAAPTVSPRETVCAVPLAGRRQASARMAPATAERAGGPARRAAVVVVDAESISRCIRKDGTNAKTAQLRGFRANSTAPRRPALRCHRRDAGVPMRQARPSSPNTRRAVRIAQRIRRSSKTAIAEASGSVAR